jgi:thermitase
MAMDQIPQTQEPKFPLEDKIPPVIRKNFMIIAMIVFGLFLLFPLAIFIMSKLPDQEQAIREKDPKKTFDTKAPFVADQLIVKLKDSYTEAELKRLKDKFDELGVVSQEKAFQSNHPSLKNYYILKFKPGTDIKRVGQELINLPEFLEVEPNYIITTQVLPQDPYYGQLWGLDKIQMPNAWDLEKGSNSIKIAVIDTGIDYNHKDFSGRIITKGLDLSTCNQFESRGGCVSPKSRDSDPMDDNGHGTHVAGTIGAVTNNNEGIAGINWDITLMAVKVMGRSGQGVIPDIIDGITYSVDNGAKILNLSLGVFGSCLGSYQDAVDYATGRGAIVVAAAGNSNADTRGFSPASCEGVITVGNSTSQDTRFQNSNYGTRVDISAPGTEILSLVPGGSYRSLTGTSMAAPHVAGVIGLLLSANPNLSRDEILSCLVNGADPITQEPGKPIGPRLNAFGALQACGRGTQPPTAPGLPISTPTPAFPPGVPTPTLTPNGAPPEEDGRPPVLTLTPTPTPVQTYTCRDALTGSKAKPGSIKIGSLICEPN